MIRDGGVIMEEPERSNVRIGFARVSTEDQNLTLQIDALKKAGCTKVFTDKTQRCQMPAKRA